MRLTGFQAIEYAEKEGLKLSKHPDRIEGPRIELNEDVVRALGISEAVIASVAAKESKELERRERIYRGSRPAPDVRGRAVILIDDGLATGSTMRAAVAALRQQAPARIIVAVPV